MYTEACDELHHKVLCLGMMPDQRIAALFGLEMECLGRLNARATNISLRGEAVLWFKPVYLTASALASALCGSPMDWTSMSSLR